MYVIEQIRINKQYRINIFLASEKIPKIALKSMHKQEFVCVECICICITFLFKVKIVWQKNKFVH